MDVQKTKDRAYIKFTESKQLEENQACSKVKQLRTDNGLEFDSYFTDCGILLHWIVRDSPPQRNSVTEKMNKTLLENVRASLFASGLPLKGFWGRNFIYLPLLIW